MTTHPEVAGRLDGKVALITGGARGIGAAQGELFAKAGAKILLADIRDDLGEAHAASLRAHSQSVHYVHLDVTQRGDWQHAVELAENEFGKLDTLVNTAGVALFAGAAETTDEEWDYVVGINQTGVFYGMRAAIPALARTGGGSIINVASCYAVGGVSGYFAYQASKGAVLMMTKAAAVEYADRKIRVNAILPGLIRTPMTETEPIEAVEANIRETPLGRAGTAMEVAYATLYLAADDSSYVTGAELAVDGGYLAH